MTTEEQGHQQGPNATIAIKKGMNRLKLDYGMDRGVIKRAVMGEPFRELPMSPKRPIDDRPFRYG